MENKSVFAVLSAIDCNEHTEKKNGLTYLSWAWAWHIVKSNFPKATYTVYEDARGLNYFTDGRTCYVKTGVTIEGIEYIEYLPVMDFRNASITVDKVTSFDINKSIQRSLTKAVARHGLGLYIYAGEDLPEQIEDAPAPIQKKAPVQKKDTTSEVFKPMKDEDFHKCVMMFACGYQPKEISTDVRTYYIGKTHAGTNEIKAFDDAVTQYKVDNKIF